MLVDDGGIWDRREVTIGRRLYERLGIELTGTAAEAMIRWHRDRPQDRHGTHRYDAGDFGLDVGQIRERMHGYVERYGLN